MALEGQTIHPNSLKNLKSPVTKDLTGKVFGKITVLRQGETRPRKYGPGTRTYWICKCDCGNEIERATDKFGMPNAGKKGCGSCSYTMGERVDPKVRGLKALYSQYKTAARNANREFALSRDELETLTSSDCFYCGVEPQRLREGYKFNGIDRKDNDKGYTPENSLSCCAECNIMKKDFSYEEFLERVSKIHTRRNQ